ncbi:hypothetical protein MNBD_GAMMA12-496 [hydrothermal vent metagenome]|uniref:Actin-like protein N-terminal domain-containing protein n=1 Tax=hydrothermal vent metagenome TaxID=652676 RepID=A0A3B0ZDD6_9ZZZZ
MRCVKRTIDIGSNLTKFIRFEKSDGTLLFSSIPSIVRKTHTKSFQQKEEHRTPIPNKVSIFGQQYLVGSSSTGNLIREDILSNREYFFEHYMALVSSVTSHMDESIIDELILTAPLSRITWLQKRTNSYLRRPICYPNHEPIIIKKNMVVPSCYGSYLNYLYHSRNSIHKNIHQYLLIDFGHQLVEWLAVNASRPSIKHSGFMKISHNHSANTNNKSLLVNKEVKRLFQRIAPVIHESCCQQILLTGGLAPEYETALHNIVPGIPVITAPDNIYANVLGYQRNLINRKL